MKTSLLLTFGLLLSAPAIATLGESDASIDQDITNLKATKVNVVTRHALSQTPVAYVVQELDVDGVQVKEYVNETGSVFAISWSGSTPPDLKTLFGTTLFTAFSDQQSRQILAPGRRPAALEASDIRVVRWGHMGALHGRAIVPRLLPKNLPEDSIQ